ncbi:25S rRNA (adenine645-N1)-methyltransferase [Ceratobasidium sp. UAMH 11750]|nr:25S rRNA (adenine645-N1)-methyltransferase [Ceratobasidium sp. UAMH 11750]
MALFESTWDTANSLGSLSAPGVSKKDGKRKREDGTSMPKQNIDLGKLMEKMAGVAAAGDEGKKKGKGKGKKKEVKGATQVKTGAKTGEQGAKTPKRNKDTMAGGRSDRKKNKRAVSRTVDAPPSTSSHANLPSATLATSSSPSSKSRNQKPEVESEPAPVSRKRKKRAHKEEDVEKPSRHPDDLPQSSPESLTALQHLMKNNLEGARFRFINEQLYKSSSNDAQEMMRKEPQVYAEYHTGFRHQTKSWPVNPVTLIAASLSSLPPRRLIVDLGCGDAQLAKTLVPDGLNVLSFDLVSDGAWVVEADICTKVPLPGSEQDGEDEQAVVDACVCSLSLMSTNWVGCVREAWRVLRMGGRFIVAEVTSRFRNTDLFVEVLSEVGFELTEQTAPSTHFLLFEFRKVARKGWDTDEWVHIRGKAEALLKPCEYKRR